MRDLPLLLRSYGVVLKSTIEASRLGLLAVVSQALVSRWICVSSLKFTDGPESNTVRLSVDSAPDFASTESVFSFVFPTTDPCR